MSITIVHQTAIDSSAGSITVPAVTPGNTMLLAVVGNATVTSVSGLGATWTAIGTPVSGGGSDVQWWLGSGLTSGTSIAVNQTSYLAAWELAGSVAAAAGGTASATTGNPSLTVTGLAANELVCVVARMASAYSTAPSTPWTTWTPGSYWNQYFSIASQTTTGSTNQTATWTGSNSYGVAGVILSPVVAATAGLLPLLTC